MRLNTIERKKFRVRKKLKNVSKDRYRLSVSRSSKNISAQIIDDVKNITLISASSLLKELKSQKKNKSELSTIVAKYLANKALFVIAFLTFSIAAGRYLLSLIPTAPGFLNSFFIFEVATFFISIFFMIYLRTLNQPAKKHDVGDVATNES